MAAANPNRGRPRDREVIRDTIIAAARRVAARDGIAEVSLSRVATEANFAPGVVYGHFRSKNELLLSVVANDLSAMASEMRETGWPDDEDTSTAQVALPLEEPIAEQIPNAIAEVVSEPAAEPEEEIEPFAGNAGLTAVARALREPDGDAITSHDTREVHEEIPAEPTPAEEPIAEDHSEPVAEAEPVIEKVLESIAKVWAGPAVLPEDDMDPFGGDDMPAQTYVAPPAIPELTAEIVPASETKFEAVQPEDDLEPFSVPPAEPVADAIVEPIAEVEAAPATEETMEVVAPVSDSEEPAEPAVAEIAPVEELVAEAPALSADLLLEAIDADKAADLAIQNMPAVQKKRHERTQLNDIINRLVLPDAPSSKDTSGAIARLDRRMSVFEKALADMEVRYGAIERENSDAVLAVAESVKVLTYRVEAGEKRALEITSELRGGILDAATRLAAVEAIMHSTTMGTGSTPAPRINAPLPIETPMPDFTPTPVSRQMPSFEPKTGGNDFMAAARRSAAAAMPVEPMVEEENNTGSNRMRYLLGGGSVLVLMLAVGGYFVSAGHTKQTPVVHVKHTVVSHVRAAAAIQATPPATAAQVPATAAPQLPAAAAPIAAPAQTAPVAAPLPAPVESVKSSRKHKMHAAVAPAVTHVAPVHVTAVHTAPKSVQNEPAPLDHLTDLARAGNAKAQMIVGLQYLDSDDAASRAAAAHWLHEAALKGEPVAQYRLGTLYQRGRGVPADTIEAMHWYEAAAKQGNIKAMYNLGLAYVQTGSAPKDFAQAAHWFTQAANLGFVDAQFNLAVLYERGAGVPQSLVDAYKWYAIAGAEGDGVSRERISALGTQLNADDLMLAQKAAQAFRPSAPDRAVNAAPTMADLN